MTDPQAAIDAQTGETGGSGTGPDAESRDPRIHGRTAGEVGDLDEVIPFIGAGPGDPGLLTVTGRELVEAADLVVHAGSLVNSELLEAYCADAELVSSVGKDLEELIPLMRDAYEAGRNVVRLHSGDPAIYGAALEQMDALEHEGVPTSIVPGVTSAFAASATLRTQLTLNGVANHVAFTRPQGKTLDPDDDHVGEFVEMGDVTTCIYLGTHAIAETMDRLLAEGHDPDTPVTVVYHASWPDEDVIEGTIATIGEAVADAGYRASALVVIGDAARKTGYERSYLYGDWANRGADGEDDSPEADADESHGSDTDETLGADAGEPSGADVSEADD
ncbi:cobalt-precorrin-4/precorrin-4 C(11)-methyltransferase [haloarchaeon 3A1-DGR]|nr:cobalt-precorrin-4/precorrin-4 C(11)-methyltransferase [haloarchaeon 3A1-DGR]